MTITPFFTGLPTAMPTDPTLADAGAGSTGDGSGSTPFGDALAAALLATLPVPAELPAGLPGDAIAPGDAQNAAPAGIPAIALAALAPSILTEGAASAAPVASDQPTPTGTSPAIDPMGTTTGTPITPTGRASADATGSEGSDGSNGSDEQLPSERSVASTHPLPGHRDPATVDASNVLSPVTAATSPKTVERAVVQQVFPEVTRIVASTSPEQVARTGTQRITLTLQPEQLGEVRVTLTVKDGAVQVRLAGNANDVVASTAVHRALSTGIPELQRLLEHAGAAEARVFVKDPAGTQPSSGAQGFASLTADAGRDGNSAWGRQSENAGQSGPGPDSGRPDSGHPGQSHHARRERQPVAGVPDPATAPTTRPAGQLDRSL